MQARCLCAWLRCTSQTPCICWTQICSAGGASLFLCAARLCGCIDSRLACRISERQTEGGGLNGRPEKLPDVRACQLSSALPELPMQP